MLQAPTALQAVGDLVHSRTIAMNGAPFTDMKEAHVNPWRIGAIVAIVLIGFQSCAGREPAPVPLNLHVTPPTYVSNDAAGNSAQVVVTAFADDRSDRTKLGVHRPLWGSSEPLTLRGGTVGEATARAFAEYLKRQGWRVRYAAPGADSMDGDIIISGKVLESSVDAHGGLGSTDIQAKHKLLVHANNHHDGSSITHTVSHHGSYNVFWFSPEDAEEILSDVMHKNFEKFIGQTRLESTAVRFK